MPCQEIFLSQSHSLQGHFLQRYTVTALQALQAIHPVTLKRCNAFNKPKGYNPVDIDVATGYLPPIVIVITTGGDRPYPANNQ